MKKHKKNSIWNRLKTAFLLILCMPILGLGGYLIYSSAIFVKEERVLEVGKLIEQNVLDLNNRMEQCENSLVYAASNYTLQEFLQMDENNYLEVNQASRNVGPLLYNVMLSNQYYKKLQIYSDKQFSVLNDLIRDAELVREENWYKKTLETSDICWWYEDGRIFITKKISTAYPVKNIGVIYAEIKEKLFKSSFQIFENVPVVIQLYDGTHFFPIESTELAKKNRSEKDFEETQSLIANYWNLIYRVDSSYFYPKMTTTMLVPAVVIITVLCAALFAVHVALQVLVKEVDYLVDKVEAVKEGNLEIRISPVQTEELNILANSMNEMLERIRQLIQKVYQTEVEQKELELEILRSKISPHFLYNNLSAINWLAIEREEEDIYEITTQMAAFYRTALNKGKNMDRLQIEITNVKAYIRLQLIAHEDSFDVKYEIDESLMDCVIPTFIMQPLVENAIEHGIDLLRDRRGLLVVRVFHQDKVLYLQVEDNGTKLYQEIGENVLETDRYGYGTGNVHRRIQLIHGEKFGLKISASEKGTISELQLKIAEKNVELYGI